MEAWEIFLSHSGEQKGFAKDLEKKLSKKGYSVFFDQKDESLPTGKPFTHRIFDAARTCKLGVVVLSDDFFTSRWPMLELCAFAERLPPLDASAAHDHPNSFTLVPLFYELSPDDIKSKVKEEREVNGWFKAWEEFERRDGHRGRISVAKCEEAVAKLLPSIYGIVRGSRREQGEGAYTEEVATKIKGILPCRSLMRLTAPGEQYSGEERLCDIILDEFRKLKETEHPSPSNLHAYVLGMYGVPGSGKTTLCRLLCGHDAILDEFGENVIFLELPTRLNPKHVAADSRKLIQQYSKLLTRGKKEVTYRDLDEVRKQLPRRPRNRHKLFLVLDNISISNQEIYKTMLQDIMSSAILLPGSKVMLVGHSAAILEFMLVGHSAAILEEQCFTYRHAIVEVPEIREKEAMEIIRKHCHPFVADDHDRIARHFFQKRGISSYSYTPFFFVQIGIGLSQISRNNANPKVAMKQLLEIVSGDAKDAVHKLVAMNFEQMPEERRVLFFDMALFIIPTVCSEIDKVALILNRMHTCGTMDDDKDILKMKMKIYDLRKYCDLSIVEDRLRIHDIYMEYAKNKCVNSTTYVNATWSNIILDAAAPSASAGLTEARLKYLEARTVNIGGESMDGEAADRDIHLDLEIGDKTKAVIVTYNSHYSAKCDLVLSGNLSSLVCLEMQNVQLVAFSPSTARGADLSNLFKLELRNWNEDPEDTTGIPSSRGQKRKHMTSFLDIIRLDSSGRMLGLRELRLWNSGVRRLDDIGRYCPRLQNLIIHDERQQLMSVSIGSSTPELKILVIEVVELDVGHRVANIWKPAKSSIVLQLGECRELEEVSVDVRPFDQMEVECPLSSEWLSFAMITDRNRAVIGMPLISHSSLSQLRDLTITCDKEETLNVTQHRLPLLETLIICDCRRLARVSIHPSCLPKLDSLVVLRCKKLQVFEGLECLVKEQLQWMELEYLPHLECEVRFGGVQLESISVIDCPGVKISYDVLVSSERMIGIQLLITCLVIVEQQKEPALLDANHVHDMGCFALNRISLDERDDDSTMEAAQQPDADTESDVKIGISPYQDTAQKKESGDRSCVFVSAEECSNTQSQIPALPQCPTTVGASLLSQNCLTICNGQFTSLQRLWLHGCQQEHLGEIEGLQYLLKLGEIGLCDFPSLTRISGTWPPSIFGIDIRNCPKLQEAPCLDSTHKLHSLRFRDCGKLKAVEFEGCIPEIWIVFEGCESMETFPMENAIEELGKKKKEYPELKVLGSKFASAEVMRRWLRAAQWESCLWAAAVECLMWEYMSKGSEDAWDALVDHLSALPPHKKIVLPSSAKLSQDKLNALPSASKEVSNMVHRYVYPGLPKISVIPSMDPLTRSRLLILIQHLPEILSLMKSHTRLRIFKFLKDYSENN